MTDPPIEEVVCGVVFEPVAELDALEQGIYWHSVANRYPHKQIQPALIEGFGLFAGVAPLRSWLIAEAKDFLLQIQADRFYMNWRRRDSAYPRFSDHNGAEGLCTRALEEFESFSEFVRQRFNVSLRPKRIELQKVDLVSRSKHWADLHDLATILPVVNTFAEIRETDRVNLNLQMVEKDEQGVTVTLQITTRTDANHQPDTVQLDFRCGLPLEPENIDFKAAFYAANSRLNSMFAGLFAPAAWRRFGAEP